MLDKSDEVDEWLDQNDLGEYKKLFRDSGTYSFSSFLYRQLIIQGIVPIQIGADQVFSSDLSSLLQ